MPVWGWFFIAAGVLIALTVAIGFVMSVIKRAKVRRLEDDDAADPVETSDSETTSATMEVAEDASSEDELLSPADASDLQSRWSDIEAAFVDDPAGSVEKADRLIEEAIEQLMSRVDDARSRLGAQWARDDAASTEDLRVALTRYRDFFQRLLSV
ncbi:hypothetical protein H7J93_13960 [Mycobacterium barrassiae]|uniref:hypothetical protein n=1 Tax=Mycobacterium barrassiae TaxID=319709 RepID=UPI002265E018|nr:hypothetical protein [Mycobacterium barrassiae]MCV7300735.1 hypothetical protein [Mycobacterium barrassiae]